MRLSFARTFLCLQNEGATSAAGILKVFFRLFTGSRQRVSHKAIKLAELDVMTNNNLKSGLKSDMTWT